MKTIAIGIILAAAAFCQSNTLTFTGTDSQTIPVKFLVEYTTRENCQYCAYSYAMNCAPEHPDCNTPKIEVSHVEEFATVKDALTFINNGLRIPDTEFLHFIASDIGPFPRTFKRLISFTEVPLDKDVQRTEIPQPAKAEEKVTYRYGQEIGEVQKPLPVGTTGILSVYNGSTMLSDTSDDGKLIYQSAPDFSRNCMVFNRKTKHWDSTDCGPSQKKKQAR